MQDLPEDKLSDEEQARRDAHPAPCSPFAGSNRHERRKQAAMERQANTQETEKL